LDVSYPEILTLSEVKVRFIEKEVKAMGTKGRKNIKKLKKEKKKK